MSFDPVSWIALAVMVFGLYLRSHAVMVLGQYFTWHVDVKEKQPVIQTGPYRFIRHPGYAGAWLTYAGTAVFLTSWYSLVPTVIFLTLAFVRRIRLEEATLERTLGEAYVEYGKRTARLCPGIW
jgi:protein-S-isoprenylcysteine O-methyltransferase Ste14